MQGNVNIPDSTITSALTFRNLVLMNMQQLTNFPYIEQDFDALTDYELLCLVVKFLNDVIANQNEQNDSITNMYNAFLALQTYVNNTKDTLEDAFNELDDYVRNYFANLDVQDEIDNKLDEYVEDGTLEHIIASYLQTQKIYNTHAEMIADADNLVDGLNVQTLGYTQINDGGGAFYQITDTEDLSAFQDDLENGLYATLIGNLSPENTGLDVADLINNYNDHNLEFHENKIYEVSSPITIRDVKYYDFKNSTIKYVGSSNVTDLIDIGYSHLTENVNIRKYAGIKNVNIDGNNKVTNCLHIVGGKCLKFENINIKNPLGIGLLADNSVGQLWELILTDIQADAGNSSGQGTNAIKLLSMTDSYFTNIFAINGSESWLYSSANACTFTNIHGYRYPDDISTTQTQGFHLYGNGNFFTNIIVDTADTVGIKMHGNYNIFDKVSLGVKAGGKGIIDSDYNSYSNIKSAIALACVIEKPTRGSYLQVKNLQINSTYPPTTDIDFLDGKLPYTFLYDNSYKGAGSIYTKFRKLNQWIYYPNETATIDLPYEAGDANYRVEVYMRNKQVGCSISRTTTQATITFPDGTTPAGNGTNFDVYIVI